MGPIPKTLRPVFRDRHDFDAGGGLAEQTVAALDGSAALILVASPAAAESTYVNEEVRLFKSRHPERPVIPLISEDATGNVEKDCFPAALRFEVGADGTITANTASVLAADLRETGDGRELALAKVIARIIGLAPDEVFRRAKREQQRKDRIRNGIVAVLVLLTVAAMSSAVYAWQLLKTNEEFLSATLKRATEIVNTAVAQAEKYNMPRTATLELLTKAESLFDDMAQLGRSTPELRYRKAWMLIAFARNYEILGDTSKQGARAAEAHRLLQGLAAEKPDDTIYQRSMSVALNDIGNVLVAEGKLPEALKSFRASFAIAERLTKADTGNASWQRDLSVSYEKVGDVLVAQGNLPEALRSFGDSLAIRERLAKVDPANAGRQRDLSVAYDKVGDVLVARGNLSEAFKSFGDSLAIRERLAKVDPANAGRQRDLSVSYNKVGDVHAALGNLSWALKSFRDSLAIRAGLAKADPNNTGWHRDLSESHGRVGDALMAQGNLPEALKSFRDSLAIRERLSKADPSNAGWQFDLGISNERIGDIQSAQGDLAAALQSYQAKRDIISRLTKADPSNAGWQRDLSVSHNNMGDALVKQGNLPAALDNYRAMRIIAERLVKVDAGNADWQRDLAVSHERIGDTERALNHPADALAAFEHALGIYDALLKTNPDNTSVLVSSTVPLMRLSELDRQRRRIHLDRALKILKDLDAAGRLEDQRRSSIAWLEWQIECESECSARGKSLANNMWRRQVQSARFGEQYEDVKDVNYVCSPTSLGRRCTSTTTPSRTEGHGQRQGGLGAPQ